MAKMNRRIDSITSFRSRTPTNEQTASNFTNMAFDHSRQRPLLPDRKANVLIENTQGIPSEKPYRPMNLNARPFALGIDGVGGAPVDVGGVPNDRGTNKYGRY